MKHHTYVVRVIVCCLLLTVLGASLPAQAANGILHVIIAVDTDDFKIGNSVATDLKNFTAFAETAAHYADLKLALQSFSGHEFRYHNVIDAVQELQVGTDDRVIFYYSGHGERTERKDSQWPNLRFATDTLDFGQVIEALQDKNPKFLMAIADACNVVPPRTNSIPKLHTEGLFPPNTPDGYEHMLLEYEGYFVASSSRPDEYSYAPAGGSLFTNDFLTKLYHELSSRTPDWYNIQSYELRVPGSKHRQHPQYVMDIQRISIDPVRVLIEMVDPDTRTVKTRFYLGDPVDVRISNIGQEKVFVILMNRDAEGRRLQLYRGWVGLGVHYLSDLTYTRYTAGGPIGTERVWIEDDHGNEIGGAVSFEILARNKVRR